MVKTSENKMSLKLVTFLRHYFRRLPRLANQNLVGWFWTLPE
jgi:hypothetical protein